MSHPSYMPHGTMFHHFHGKTHSASQGSIDATEFKKLIKFLNRKNNLLSATEFHEKYLMGTLTNEDTCLTFDDALRCQYDIAAPILDDLNIKAFFFVYSSILTGDPDYLEVYRSFRHKSFGSINEFYDLFFEVLFHNPSINRKKILNSFEASKYLINFSFYSKEDRFFRYIRDVVLSRNAYDDLMIDMMAVKNFNINLEKASLWMSEAQIKELSDKGHTIGLHSHNHPTAMHRLTMEEQRFEYETNARLLREVLDLPIHAMAHPCGSYDSKTLRILKSMNISIGFRSNMDFVQNRSGLEIPRCDHTTLLALLSE